MTLKPEDAVLFYAGWEDMLFGVPTPIIVCAVLFPFKDCIITDGLVSVILVRFGGNYILQRSLHDRQTQWLYYQIHIVHRAG